MLFSRKSSGFTLVELLVVITIIGILISLLMPAVQSARESARRVTCMNNLKQMSLACLGHESKQGHLPTGGWGWGWAGEPDRGFDQRQPGGWHYNILPFMDEQVLHQAGSGGNRAQAALRGATPIPAFNCPSRRDATTYPYTHGSPYFNINKISVIARSDYAACSGEATEGLSDKGPGSLAAGDARFSRRSQGKSKAGAGVIYLASTTQMGHITDGESTTYLLGERLMNPDSYSTGRSCSNDQGWDLGFDFDVNRWTRNTGSDQPRRDTPGYDGCLTAFGSAHATGFNMSFCDGAVKKINYDINLAVHRLLGVRNDGVAVDMTAY